MQFAITRHSPYVPPSDALGLLWEQLDGLKRDGVSFTRLGSGIMARTSDEPTVKMSQDEWADKCRRAVLGILSDVCEQANELDFDWFAVSLRD